MSRTRMRLGNFRRATQKKGSKYWRSLHIVLDKAAARFRRFDIAIFHEFPPSLGGGGNQFMRALWNEFEQRGLRMENNTISYATSACLFNSFNFDFQRLKVLHRHGCRMIHRVDGPIGVYRGHDEGIDQSICEINQELADATIFQSRYSMQKHLELGLEFKSPCVIMNAVDPTIFHSRGRLEFDQKRKIRLISSSWSDNPNKGAATYKWIEDHLDWGHFEYTYIGRSPIQFQRIRMQSPVPSAKMADLLRQHDIFVFASQHEACSNALLEALSCGLPSLYLLSGSNAEVVGNAGLGFIDEQEIPILLNQLVEEYLERQASIALPSLADVANRYLRVMGIN